MKTIKDVIAAKSAVEGVSGSGRLYWACGFWHNVSKPGIVASDLDDQDAPIWRDPTPAECERLVKYFEEKL